MRFAAALRDFEIRRRANPSTARQSGRRGRRWRLSAGPRWPGAESSPAHSSKPRGRWRRSTSVRLWRGARLVRMAGARAARGFAAVKLNNKARVRTFIVAKYVYRISEHVRGHSLFVHAYCLPGSKSYSKRDAGLTNPKQEREEARKRALQSSLTGCFANGAAVPGLTEYGSMEPGLTEYVPMEPGTTDSRWMEPGTTGPELEPASGSTEPARCGLAFGPSADRRWPCL